MNWNELSDEQQAKLKSCKDSAELKSMLNGMGIELTDEQLEAAAGGEAGGEANGWGSCDSRVCPCDSYLM